MLQIEFISDQKSQHTAMLKSENLQENPIFNGKIYGFL